MDNSIRHICKHVISIDADASIQEILDDNRWDKVSGIVVVDKNKNVVGIISDKDIIYAETLGIKKKDIKAWQVCSRNIFKVSPDDTVAGAARLMVDNKIHHVLVMTGDYVEGIVSSLDALQSYLDTK